MIFPPILFTQSFCTIDVVGFRALRSVGSTSPPGRRLYGPEAGGLKPTYQAVGNEGTPDCVSRLPKYRCSGQRATYTEWRAKYLILTKNLRYAKRFIIDIVEKETKAMKHAAAKSTVDMLHKIEAIEKEVMDLKLSVLRKTHPFRKKGYIAQGYSQGCGDY